MTRYALTNVRTNEDIANEFEASVRAFDDARYLDLRNLMREGAQALRQSECISKSWRIVSVRTNKALSDELNARVKAFDEYESFGLSCSACNLMREAAQALRQSHRIGGL